MKEFIIGKEGTQPFAIPVSKSRVSRQHARIIIDDNGTWTLEDLNSTNGTYIVDENGELQQIKRVRINEYTRIVLADMTAMGYSFLAHHVLEENPKDYSTEFRYIIAVHEQAKHEMQHIEEKFRQKSKMKYVPSLVSAVAGLAVTIILPPEYKVYGLSSTGLLTVVLSICTNSLIDNKKEKETFRRKYDKILICPCCGRRLTEEEFKNQICLSCKAHA